MPGGGGAEESCGCVAAAALVTCFCAASLRAHEIGTTRVSVAFADDGTYQIEIVTDAAALVEKLEASSGASSPAETQADRLQNLLRSFDETFRKRVNIAFDGVEVQPTATYFVTTAVDNSSAASATIRLKGQTPADAKHFTWTYSWTFASYALTVRRAPNESAVTEWLEGNQRSAPLALSVPSPPIDRLGTAWRYLTLGFTHIVPKGLDHVLFVLGIYLLSHSRPFRPLASQRLHGCPLDHAGAEHVRRARRVAGESWSP